MCTPSPAPPPSLPPPHPRTKNHTNARRKPHSLLLHLVIITRIIFDGRHFLRLRLLCCGGGRLSSALCRRLVIVTMVRVLDVVRRFLVVRSRLSRFCLLLCRGSLGFRHEGREICWWAKASPRQFICVEYFSLFVGRRHHAHLQNVSTNSTEVHRKSVQEL